MAPAARRSCASLLLLLAAATATLAQPQAVRPGVIGVLEGASSPSAEGRECPAPRLAPDALHWAEGAFLRGEEACPQLHANDPEVITRVDDGRVIAVSTLSPAGRTTPAAHLDRSFQGRFRIFASHQNRSGVPLHQVLVLHAPGDEPVRVRVRALSSSATHEAPYRDWLRPAEVVESDPLGRRASGPGDAAASAALRGWRAGPAELVVPARGTALLLVRPLPQGEERVTHAELIAPAPVQAAVLYLPAPPAQADVELALRAGALLPRGAHDPEPTPPGAAAGPLVYGRVAGVVEASTWSGRLATDAAGEVLLTVPGAWRFGWNALQGPGQARMVAAMSARNPHSAWRAWGSYGAELRLEVPLQNPTALPMRVRVLLESLCAPAAARSFRGSFELQVQRGDAPPTRTWVHAIQRSGQRGRTPLVELGVAPGERARLLLRTIYSANNQAPQALRVEVAPAPLTPPRASRPRGRRSSP